MHAGRRRQERGFRSGRTRRRRRPQPGPKAQAELFFLRRLEKARRARNRASRRHGSSESEVYVGRRDAGGARTLMPIRMPTKQAIVALLVVLVMIASASCSTQTKAPPSYGELVVQLSEEGGYFDTDNLISNETAYVQVVEDLEPSESTGGGLHRCRTRTELSLYRSAATVVGVHRGCSTRQHAAPPACSTRFWQRRRRQPTTCAGCSLEAARFFRSSRASIRWSPPSTPPSPTKLSIAGS